jgi:hypothetical protein
VERFLAAEVDSLGGHGAASGALVCDLGVQFSRVTRSDDDRRSSGRERGDERATQIAGATGLQDDFAG